MQKVSFIGRRPHNGQPSIINIDNPRKRQALSFAHRGWPVFPLHSVNLDGTCSCGNPNCARSGKHPLTANGLYDASYSSSEIEAFWRKYPSANLGVRTGNGLLVIDVDGAAGEASLLMLEARHKPLPVTLEIATGRGRHLYFATGAHKIPSSVGKLGNGLDVRADGGYVVGPTSRHANGRFYKPIRRGRSRVADAPLWLVEMAKGSGSTPSKLNKPSRPGRLMGYGNKALEGEVARVVNALPHTRNNSLNHAAFKLAQLAKVGVIEQEEITAALTRAAKDVGLADEEIGPTIKSGLTAGLRKPRLDGGVDDDTVSVDVDDLTSDLAGLGQTDSDNAERFYRRFGDRLMCTPGQGFLVYDGNRWVSDNLLEHLRLAEETARLIAKEAICLRESDRFARIRWAEQSRSRSAIDRMCFLVKARMMVDDAKLDADAWRLNVSNGTINLRTGSIEPQKPDGLITKLAPLSFSTEAKCPEFKRFLRRALGEDDDLLRFVQKAIGYTLTGDTREQVLFLAQGPTKTGKSTFVNLCRVLLGDYGLHTPSETLLVKHYDSSSADLARLKGARMVSAIEVNWNRQIDEAKVKAMTGGDPITARHLYRNYFEFNPEFKLWFAVNDFPKARGTDGAFWERVRVIPFNVQIPWEERVQNLPQILLEEGAGIMKWAVDGCLLWQSEGLGTCSAVEEASGHWKRAADHVRKFVNEEVIHDSTSIIQSSDLHSRYEAWCDQHGESPVGIKKFKSNLEALDFTSKRSRTGTIWQGVKLRIS